jgi:diguanylate cyclase (GGDEF)-like protein
VRSKRHRFSLSLMMLDVDDFKAYNDKYGHPAGDSALKAVADILKETLRGADVAARYGGEEFAILLPQTSSEEAAQIAERIRKKIERTEFPERKVTASIGIASCSNEVDTPRDLISAADVALYAAKNHGRNNVQIFNAWGESVNDNIH